MSLSDRLIRYLTLHPEWFNGGELERLALEAGYKSSNCSRRLREMAEDGLIERELRKSERGIKSVYYKIKSCK